MNLFGRVYGYRARVWTNWYHHCWLVGVLLLAYMRELLNANNLKSTYPPGQLVAFLTPERQAPAPAPGVSHFRTADGSWNNPDDPKEGAAGTRFLRNVELSATFPETDPRLFTPDPRKVSLELLTRPDGADGRPDMAPVPFLNLLAASWIQFMNHDWISHGDVAHKSVITVPLQKGDPAPSATGNPLSFSVRPRLTRRAVSVARSPPPRASSTRSPTGGTARRFTAATRPPKTACAATISAR